MTFLHAYQTDSAYTVNKQYKFQIEAGAFDPKCRDLIEDLVGVSETYQLLGKAGLQVKGKLDKRYLLLPVHRIQELLEAMEKTGNLSIKLGEKPILKCMRDKSRFHSLWKNVEKMILV